MRKTRFPFKYLFVVSVVIGLIGCQDQFNPLESITTDGTSTDTDQVLSAGKASAAANRFIVIFDGAVNSAAGERFVTVAGGTLVKQLPAVNGSAVILPAQAVAALWGTEGVLLVEKDRIVSLPDPGLHGNGKGAGKPDKPPKGDKEPPPPPPAETTPWGVDRIDADLAWAFSTGASVRVGILDTGIDPTHPDLNVVGGVNIINTRKSSKDDNGHGTHVAGDLIASFSSRGPEVDLIAPGVGIVSTYLGSGYAIGSGTSMAAPHVTGAVALVLSAQPGLGPEEVRALLKAKADDIGLAPDEQGAGLVDAEEPVSTVIPFVNWKYGFKLNSLSSDPDTMLLTIQWFWFHNVGASFTMRRGFF
jgi:subtilisin family serine protease